MVLCQCLLSMDITIRELYTLEWGDINLKNGTIVISKIYYKRLTVLITANIEEGNKSVRSNQWLIKTNPITKR